MDFFRIALYIVFGILPSLVWLLYYLRKDLHPEPKKMIITIFLLGCLMTIPAFLIQVGLTALLQQLQLYPFFGANPLALSILKWFIAIAFVEEFLKYLVVKMNVLGSYVVDEPLDIMLYMVVAALGFTAVENLLYLLPINNLSASTVITTTILLSFVRFIGATFLHTLCAALVGYFVAIASLKKRKELLLTVVGLGLSTLFHGLYDFSIVVLDKPLDIIIPVAIILILAAFMLYDFDGMKKIKSICKI